MTVNHDVAGSSPAGGARKKHLRKQVLFSTKFAFGEWNMASPCEIATLWNICFANVKRRISFHIERSEIFHNFRKKIVSHSAMPNISLNSRVAFLYYEHKKERGDRFVLFLSKPQAWYIIDARSAAYIISPCGAAYHHAPACISPAAWWDTTLRVDDIHGKAVMICKAPPWFILPNMIYCFRKEW